MQAALPFSRVCFFEEGMESGGIGEHFCRLLMEAGFRGRFQLRGIEDTFVRQAAVERELEWCGLDEDSMVRLVLPDHHTDGVQG